MNTSLKSHGLACLLGIGSLLVMAAEKPPGTESNAAPATLSASTNPTLSQVILTSVKDALLDEDRPKNNMGSSIFAAKVASFRSSGYNRIMLVQFDLSGLPSTNISQATFRIHCPPSGWDRSIDATFHFFGMLKPWTEGSGVDTTGSETYDGASWTSRDGTNEWNGGSIVGGGGTNSLGNFDMTSLTTVEHSVYEEWIGKWIEVDITPLARLWASGGQSNNGFAVCALGRSTNNAYTMFATREFNRDGYKPGQAAPQLVIRFDPVKKE